jgi:uncharacterized damage-inducible protein DinB
MFTREGVKALHGWTHASLDLVVEHAASLPADLFVREVPGFSLPTLRDQLLHVLSWEATWVRHLRGTPAVVLTPDGHPDLTALVEAKRRVAGETATYIDGLTELALNTDLSSLPPEWAGPPRSPAFILLHVVTHAFHHKGQMASMFRLLGHPPPDTDLQR